VIVRYRCIHMVPRSALRRRRASRCSRRDSGSIKQMLPIESDQRPAFMAYVAMTAVQVSLSMPAFAAVNAPVEDTVL
jgi:hypothetical protein